MDFSNKVETDQLIKIYRQISNTLQQTLHSCNLLSCPLKHFLLYFQFKTTKKKINEEITKYNQHNNNNSNNIINNKDKLNSSFSY